MLLNKIKSLLCNKKTVVVLSSLLLLAVVYDIYFFTRKDDKELLSYNENRVEYQVVEDLYKDIDKTSYDNEKEAVSKVYGYTYDKDGVIIVTVKEGYTLNNKVYDLSDNYIGEYSEDTLNKVLEKGTSKIYEYVNINGEYVLLK